MQFVDISQLYQSYQSDIDARMRQVLEHGQFIMGPEVQEIEQVLADYVGVGHCITTGSGTVSLEIALRALGIGPGDEVITVPFTWISTAEVIAQVGARPVFVDIEPETYNLDASLLEAAITEHTKAIMPVSLFGQMPDFSAIQAVASRHGIPVIEDAAQSFGATQGGRRSGGVSAIGSTSFFPAKPFGCFGDGGALFTDDGELAEKMAMVRNHGCKVRHDHPMIGLNGRFDTLQAAVLLARFPHFEKEVVARQRVGQRYDELLAGICSTPVTRAGNTHVYAQYTIRVEDRDGLQAWAKEQGVPMAVYYPACVHQQPAYQAYCLPDLSLPVAEKAAQEVISLPMHPFLTEEDQVKVAEVIQAFVKRG